jgi:hypothetical protein
LHDEIYPFKKGPYNDRPEEHQEKFSSPIHHKRILFNLVNDTIYNEDIGPPGKIVKPCSNRFKIYKEEDL